MVDPRERFPDIDIQPHEAQYIMEFETARGQTITDHDVMRFCVYLLRMPPEDQMNLLIKLTDTNPNQ